MKKNILIINSRHPSPLLFMDLFEELSFKKYNFFLLSNNDDVIKKFLEKKWPNKKIPKFLNLNSVTGLFLFIILAPVGIPVFFFWLWYIKYFKKIDIIICCNWFEKISITPLAKIMGLKIFWMELPGLNYKKINKILSLFFKTFSRWAKIIVFIEYTKEKLIGYGIKNEQIIKIKPGIRLKNHQHQDNIFNNMARYEQKINIKRKFFTIGVITELNSKQKIEILFQAVSKCLNIIPRIQVIIIGDGEERKSLIWLSKKMEIDNLVWFVGEQNHLRKWLDTFDIFVEVNDTLYLHNIFALIQILSSGVPIIAPGMIGCEDLIEDKKNGILLDLYNSESLSQEIINLYKKKNLSDTLAKNSIELIDNNFGIDKMTKEIDEVLKMG
ncbi:MAG: glycosyltransferase family 4 protein [bacterium]